MKRIQTALAALAFLVTGCTTEKNPMDVFINDLMSKMTLQEKIGQLNQQVAGEIVTGSAQDTKIGHLVEEGKIGSVLNIKGVDNIRALQQIAVEKSRLGIPIIVGMDIIHGFETQFPIPLGLAATWDLEGIQQSARIAAQEASANGVAWTFSPMVDICIDSRWGRQAEGAGEDPFLGSRIAEAMVTGYQGTDPNTFAEDEIMACVKHFALYGAAEAGRDYNTVDMSRLRMYNQYLPPYKAAIEAGAGSVMSSFNIVDGQPSTANRWLLTDLLRKEWNFGGFVVTDYASIDEMVKHGIYPDKQHNAAMALKAGTDMDMVARAFLETLEQSVKEGLVKESEIDQACRRVLEAKYRLGLFDDPYRYCKPERAVGSTYTKEYRRVARQLTAESLVLLKNEDNLLPLEKKGTIALIGPLAETRTDISGSWAVSQTPEKYSTLREGLDRALEGKAILLCTQGCNLLNDAEAQKITAKGHGNEPIPYVNKQEACQQALSVARQADVIICAMGENAWMNGEGTSRASVEMPEPQQELLKALKQTGKPIVLLNFAGRATALKWESENIQSILQCWYGSESGDAIADVIFGDFNPQGKLTVSMPQCTGQLPLYYNHLNTGRPVADDAKGYRIFASNYIDVRNGALYPFGYGLSYTTYTYSDIQLSHTEMPVSGNITASIIVQNTGKRPGYEIVQLYLRDKFASISRPVKELKGFQRIHLNAGESKTVTFEITPELLKFYNNNLQHVIEPGEFDLMIGPNSRDVKTVTFNVK